MAIPHTPAGTALPDGRVPVLLSAHAEDLIGADAAAIAGYLRRRPAMTDVSRVAATLLRTRRVRRHRMLIRAADIGELTDALQAVSAGCEHPLATHADRNDTGRIAFVFPGQGSQWPSMGVQAYAELPGYAAEVDRCAAAFGAAGHASPLDYLMADAGARTNDFSQVQIQGAQFVHGVALARVWQSVGVTADLTVGHSLGEIGAAYIAGTVTLADAVAIVYARATLLDRLTGPYRVAVLGVGPDRAQAEIDATSGWLELSVVNSASSVAVSGDTDAVAAVVGRLTADGVFAREIEMWFPAHTTKLDPLRSDLEGLLPTGKFDEGVIPFIGSATARTVEAGTDFAEYWYTNLRSTVRFDEAIRSAAQAGVGTFIEMSAHPALLFAIGDTLDGLGAGDALMLGTGRRDEPLVDRLAANLGAVAIADPEYRWPDLLPGNPALLPDFPFAPMQARHHWATPDPLPPIPGLTVLSETWEQQTPRSGEVRQAMVLDLGDAPELAAALRRRLPPADAEDADLLIVLAPSSDRLDAAAAGSELADRVDDGLLRYADDAGPRIRDIWLVTVGGEQAREGEPGPLPTQAALAAMHRSIGWEHPDHEFGHLDLPSWQPDAATAALAVDALSGAPAELAIRGTADGPILLRRSMIAPAPATRPTSRRDTLSAPSSSIGLDEVVITGGSGSVGTQFLRHVAARGARRIVLLGRAPIDVPRIDGVEVLAPRCDIADPAALTSVAAEFGGGGATLLIHAAGAARIADHRDLTGADIEATMAAKVTGLANIARIWPLRTDARIIVCSSVSGLWGGAGHAAYAAANRLTDVLTAQLRAEGRQATAVRWGLWPGRGIIDAAEIARVQRSGLLPMDADRAIETVLRDIADDPLVFTADTERLHRFLGAPDPAPATASAVDNVDVDIDVEQSAAGLDAAGVLRVALTAVLKLPDEITPDPAASLLDLGVDSLLALDLRKKLKNAAGANVPLAAILGGATVAEVIEHMQRTTEGTPQ
ncbi:mycobactin polyketide synthase MbtD [Mycolicibacterium neoaurum]|uniref:mycobactin polyketide synthase MbtD n=1 Tax=Mycolicibacterium neoaurum TaxID=1795 RepID=UPI0026714784|nr:mycobactin polyketide synthase MbtD [Mycolicibacterium neoaurum]MDO3398739.1 mycobactin polyketide synthase MbtD [Mycolicibacterium neoaurum]